MIRSDDKTQFEHFIPYSFMQEIQRKSDIPAHYIIFSLLFSSILVSSGYLSQSLTNTISFVLPVYWTLKAIELRLKKEDKQWITYWLIWTFFYILDLPFSNLFKKIPNFYLIKLIFFIWLFLPSTMGAQILYEKMLSSYSDKFNVNILTDSFKRYQHKLTNYLKEKFGINIMDYQISKKEEEKVEKDKNIPLRNKETVEVEDEQHESRQNIVSNAKINTDNLHTNLQNVKEDYKHTIDHLRSKNSGEHIEEVKPIKQEQLIQEGRFVAGHPVIEDPLCAVMKKRHDILIESKDEKDANLKKMESEKRTVL